MSCPHEWQLSAYADTGLGAAEVRALESHLVGCVRCRRRVVALRDEARVLRDLAHERLPAPPAPARAGSGVALGLPLAIAALALVSTAAPAALDALPRPLRWIAPNERPGVSRMLVDLFFAVRDNFSVYFDFAFALAALGAVAGVAYLAADALLRRAGTGARAALALLTLGGAAAFMPAPAEARFEVRQEDEIVVTADQTIEASLIALGDDVSIDGTVRGDLVVFGDQLRIRGTVEGNVFCAGEDVELAGSVRGSIHCAGQDVRIAATTLGSVYAAGNDVVVDAAARVGTDLAVAGNDCAIGGEVGRDVFAAGDSLELSGRGARDVSLHGSDVGFRASASYPGTIELHMPEGAEPDIAAGAALGQMTRKLLDDEHGPATPIRRFTQLERLRGHLVTVVAAFLVGLVLFALAPGLFDTRVESVGRFFLAVGVGFVSLTALLAAIVLSCVSVIGIPLAIVLVLFMVALIFVGPIVVAAVVGRTVMRSESIAFRDFALALGVGTLLLGILTGLPGVGGFALFVLVLEGIGLLTLDALDWWQTRRAARLAPTDVPA
jgi:anti-sigma factor RsiW